MPKKKRISQSEELARQAEFKKLAIISMFSDDVLMERFVLKGGNALDLIYQISTRASADIDLSIDGDFAAVEREDSFNRIKKALRDTFRPKGYQVFDINIDRKPQKTTADLEDFWGGYEIEFKLIENNRYEELKDDIAALQRNALPLGPRTKVIISISKHEYTAEKMQIYLDDFLVFVYSPEMIVCEKLRAICQQTPEYRIVVKRGRQGSPRARDFIDIYSAVVDRAIDLTKEQNRSLLKRVFMSKRVKLSLLRQVAKYREFHRSDYNAVVDTVKPGVTLKEFDFYFDFVLDLINKLEPLGDE